MTIAVVDARAERGETARDTRGEAERFATRREARAQVAGFRARAFEV